MILGRLPLRYAGALCFIPNGDGTWTAEMRLDHDTIRQALYVERGDHLELLIAEDVPG